jgi:hypothetical protein
MRRLSDIEWRRRGSPESRTRSLSRVSLMARSDGIVGLMSMVDRKQWMTYEKAGFLYHVPGFLLVRTGPFKWVPHAIDHRMPRQSRTDTDTDTITSQELRRGRKLFTSEQIVTGQLEHNIEQLFSLLNSIT